MQTIAEFLTIMQLAAAVVFANIAYRKPCNQTGAYNENTADKAVDGYYDTCAQPDARILEGRIWVDHPAKWWVDLNGTYIVNNITIYTSEDRDYFFLENFILSVGRSLMDLTDCGQEYTDAVPRGGGPVINCNQQIGRFVHFRKVGGVNIHVATICEVQVTGRKTYDCSFCPLNAVCDPKTGCSHCSPGKQPPECKDECPPGTYGNGCSGNCGHCQSENDCSKTDGACSGSCMEWWAGRACDTEIVKPIWTNETMTFRDVTSTSVRVIWEQARNVPEDFIQYYGYRLEYRLARDSYYMDGPTVAHRRPTHSSAVISGLAANTDYYVRVVTFRNMTGKEFGSAYPKSSLKTACREPVISKGTPSISTELSANKNQSILVDWKSIGTSESGCDFITEIWVQYKLTNDNVWYEDVVSNTTTQHTVFPPGGGNYDIRIKFRNNGNFETSSNVAMVEIQGPPAVTTTEASTTTISDTESMPGEKVDEGSSNMVIIVAAVVVVVLAVAVVVVTVILVRKRRRKPDSTAQRVKSGSTPSDQLKAQSSEEQTSSDDHLIDVSQTKPEPVTYVNAGMIVRDRPQSNPTTNTEVTFEVETNSTPNIKLTTLAGPIPVVDLEAYTNNKKLDMAEFEEEYKTLPPDDTSRCTFGQTDENKEKNRFRNIFPYDDTRVILDPDAGGDGDYINANYITGYTKGHEYIATQGVKKNTVTALWRMVWQENANRIIMVANLSEGGKKRCEQYWPETVKGTLTNGDFTVSMVAEVISADYTYRELRLTKGSESRTVRQLHFTSWEDKNKPLNGAMTLFAFHKKVRSLDTCSKGPMIVHCSAGVGRTGTFIALDILLNQARSEGQVDIYGWVSNIRMERMTMVQTKGQYFFLHDALVDYLKSGDTSYPCNRFTNSYIALKETQALSGTTDLQRQFDLLVEHKPRVSEHSMDGHKTENSAKNRDSTIIPSDAFRPYLSTRYNEGNDYINAVFVSSFRRHRHYVVTQMPLSSTTVDFWRLVIDHNCRSIVMLNSMSEHDSACPTYWPSEDTPVQRYGPLEVKLLKVNDGNTLSFLKTRDFMVRVMPVGKRLRRTSGEGHLVRQFQFQSWPSAQDLPPNKADLLDLMDRVTDWQQQGLGPETKSHVLVHCMDGASRCGIYCAASHILDRMKIEQEVDAYLAVRYVARSRPQFIQTLNQYSFLYDLANECITRHNEYANFQ